MLNAQARLLQGKIAAQNTFECCLIRTLIQTPCVMTAFMPFCHIKAHVL